MPMLRRLGLVAALLAAPAFAEEQSATEINKQLTNPVSELWSLQLGNLVDPSHLEFGLPKK